MNPYLRLIEIIDSILTDYVMSNSKRDQETFSQKRSKMLETFLLI